MSFPLSPSLSVDLVVFFLVLCRLGIRVRVRVSLGLTRFVFLSVWVRLNPLIFSCRAPAKTAVRHLSPRGGGGDRQLSDARHPPGLFFLFSFTRLGLGFQSETDRTLVLSLISFQFSTPY